jgi:hypothetical protein
MKITSATLLLVFGLTLTSMAQWTTSGTDIFNSNTGNVGIGTSTPSSKLDLQGLNVSFRMYKSLFSGKEDLTKGRLEIKADIADQGFTALSSLNRFGSADEDLIYTLQHPIGNSVSWGIVESWRGAGLLVSASGPDLHPLLFGINRVEKARIATNGNFGIGLTSPSFLLDVNGTVRATSFVTVSDQRLKRDVRKLETPLQKILQLSGYYFKYSNERAKERNFPTGESIGFMAQNVREVLPQLVHEDSDGFLTVDYQSVIPLLVEALKELDNKISKVQELYLANLPNEKNRNPLFKDAFINQNSPNPLTNLSIVEYFLPYEASSGMVGIYDFHGNLIKSHQIQTKGKGTLEFSTEGMQPGMYFYTLIVDGTNVETRRLVVSK